MSSSTGVRLTELVAMLLGDRLGPGEQIGNGIASSDLAPFGCAATHTAHDEAGGIHAMTTIGQVPVTDAAEALLPTMPDVQKQPRELAAQAGFTTTSILPIEHPFWTFYRPTP
jgi:hypothetical protein